MNIRPEEPDDERAIARVISEAFATAPHRSGTEASIVNALREAGALTVSDVAADAGEIIGHVAASPVVVQRSGAQWFGLGPVSVLPSWQRQGIGRTLIKEALNRLRSLKAAGCVVLGEPDFYGQFGFRHEPLLHYRDIPPPYFQCLPFSDERPQGSVEYHPAFDIAM